MDKEELYKEIKDTLLEYRKDPMNTALGYNILRWAKQGYLTPSTIDIYGDEYV